MGERYSDMSLTFKMLFPCWFHQMYSWNTGNLYTIVHFCDSGSWRIVPIDHYPQRKKPKIISLLNGSFCHLKSSYPINLYTILVYRAVFYIFIYSFIYLFIFEINFFCLYLQICVIKEVVMITEYSFKGILLDFIEGCFQKFQNLFALSVALLQEAHFP